MNKEKKVSKTYLIRVLEALYVSPEEHMTWNDLYDLVYNNWDDSKDFHRDQLIKNGIIRGINKNKIEKIEVPDIKTKYLGHNYKLILN